MMKEEVGMLYLQAYIHEWIELPLSKIEHKIGIIHFGK